MEASNPYWEWLWGSVNEARLQLEAWVSRPSSEISADRIRRLPEEVAATGGVIALSGPELSICRKADLLALMNALRANPNDGFLARMREARLLFDAVEEKDFYISRIGVSASARGRGIGRRLLETAIQTGKEKGFRQFRLDVSAENDRALRLYCAAGFTIMHEASIPSTSIQYVSMVLKLGD